MPEYKATPSFTKSIDDRTVVGLGAIHGNIDEGGDRSHPGAFADTKINGRDRTRFLWQHNSADPPVAVLNYAREVTRAELPPSVLSYAPDATGGVEVSRTYLETPRGNEILTNIKAGALEEMSYAYDVSKYAFTEDETTGATVRELYGVKTYDWSDVNWGMNGATVGSKGRPLEIEHVTVLAAVESYIKRYQDLSSLRAKEGRVLSGENRKRIESAIEALANASKALSDLLAATEPKDAIDVRRLMLETQRTIARLQGVT